jgi:hypothetical protein
MVHRFAKKVTLLDSVLRFRDASENKVFPGGRMKKFPKVLSNVVAAEIRTFIVDWRGF